MIVTKAQGHGSTHVRSVQTWILDFVREGRLPFHSFCYTQQTVLEDDNISQKIQSELSKRAKSGFIQAEVICKLVASKKFQTMFARLGIHKPTISKVTAHRWLVKLRWRYSKKKNGMYIDEHERDDVVAYQQAFICRWAKYKARFQF